MNVRCELSMNRMSPGRSYVERVECDLFDWLSDNPVADSVDFCARPRIDRRDAGLQPMIPNRAPRELRRVPGSDFHVLLRIVQRQQ
jgi:hypothetical protein